VTSRPDHPEIGRELRVSELVPRRIVILHKGQTLATLWVVEVLEDWVAFRAGKTDTGFIARRCGPDLEGITDNTGAPMKVYEYLGEP
jgi:hypothetical protein